MSSSGARPAPAPGTAADLSVRVGPLSLGNPLMTASGTAGLGLELEPFLDLRTPGAIVVKTLTMKPRRGNPMPRLCETASGLLNSIGLPNKGLPHFLREVLPRLAGRADCLVVNIAGTCTGEFGEMAAMLDGAEGVDALELNISCPNVEGGDLPFGRDPDVVHRLVADVRAVTALPVITKLTPNVSDVVSIARAARAGGTDAVSLINTLLGMAVDWRTGRPRLGTTIGGLSGPAIKPVALRMCWEVARSVDVPVIGIGGIRDADDVLDFLAVGCRAVQIGTLHYRTPDIIGRVLAELQARLAETGHDSLAPLIGSVGAPARVR